MRSSYPHLQVSKLNYIYLPYKYVSLKGSWLTPLSITCTLLGTVSPVLSVKLAFVNQPASIQIIRVTFCTGRPKQHFQLLKEKRCKSTGGRKCIVAGGIYRAACSSAQSCSSETPSFLDRKLAPWWNKWNMVEASGLTSSQWLTVSLVLWCKQCHRISCSHHYPPSFTDRRLSSTESSNQIPLSA